LYYVYYLIQFGVLTHSNPYKNLILQIMKTIHWHVLCANLVFFLTYKDTPELIVHQHYICPNTV